MPEKLALQATDWRALRSALILGMGMAVLAGLGVLGACASAPEAAAVAAGDLLTPSDEPAARKRARIRLELALAYFEQGQTTVALDELNQALQADPVYAPAHNLRGLIYLRLKDFSVADESFRKALVLNPRDANVKHNLAWLLCQQQRWPESFQRFEQVLSDPGYTEQAKTFRALGLCQARAGMSDQAERNLLKSHEYDPANPVTLFNLAALMHARGDLPRAQWHVRRLNNSELANAESFWLGVKVERGLDNRVAMEQLSLQLVKRFPLSRESDSLQRGAFDE
ncbi:type IV pilus biogenesis/stability protein PilW [Comamonadaceae bacterium]|nr:type IV pilus biogenesis/stability protein PilW [Comamonadaceae bacterium]